ncbi:MAG: branched-chain amino acid transport system substrate-binding protein [Candidatus Atribacteria bacterium]|nr:branched-chain amino acid transport system substrate-binding protein [Candidatus Atribacteria bacterium]
MKKVLGLILVLALLSLSFGVALAQDTVKIGANLEMTGAVAAYGQMVWEGVNLAKEISGDQVLGKNIELVLVDNKSDRVESANAANRLIDYEKVVAMIGPAISGSMLAIGPICDEKQVPVISASATNPLVTQDRKFVFRACFRDDDQAAAAAQFAIEELAAQTAAVLSDIAQDYCVALGNFFKEAFEERGGQIVSDQYCKTGDQDFSAQLTTIINSNPDVLYLPNYYTEAALICSQARDLGFEGMILGADGADAPELVSIGEEAVEGVYFTAHADTAHAITEIGEQFFSLYREKHGREPSAFEALGADAYLIIIDAIKRAGELDPVKIRDAMEDTENLEVVTGIVTIENGDNKKPIVVKQVQGGEFVFVTTIEY